MRNQKAFTLIELLAVIVILAVVALIATPIILNLIDNVRGKSRVQTANGVLNAAKYFYADKLLDENMVYPGSGLSFECDGTSCKATIASISEVEGISMLSEEEAEPTVYMLNFSGTIPSSGSILIESNGTITPIDLAIDSHLCTYDDTKKVFTEC